ncbi:MAG: heavy-metal-associated domain-containing protein [Candidatus Moeniiplasma glomeromycotorum]|nr:heavy-metal-associated domain-containing protein [Candidatus Moeniiplasma glomeromycotorum]MCE8167116.1 heavy-metal-associated domain-containing protein [Candidatus Moeniiplasma glomeromycotorum]MCE8168872.1 heavy-metal-associated domain-containing protein [Candidatus Moeniiplasma glomeromycotorum]
MVKKSLSRLVKKIKIYYPLGLIFLYLLGITLLLKNFYQWNWYSWMNFFMAGFFLIFSFFKLLDLQGFFKVYQTYDLIAKKLPLYGYLYPIIELILGLGYLVQIYPLVVNLITFIIMGVSSIGVLISLTKKKSIQCACLGTFFELPMSKLTLFEDLLMLGMAGIMLIKISALS